MLHAPVSDRKRTANPDVASAALRRFFAPLASFSNQARLRGGKCADRRKGAPRFVGDVEDGIPRLGPDDPSRRMRGSTLPYREATELAKCIRIMGEENSAYCRETVLGEKPVKNPCTDICDRAYKDASLNGGGGGVICDGSTKCACAFDVPPLTRGQCPDLDTIVITHETNHLSDVDCDATKGLHRPPFRNPADATKSECTHRKQSITELDGAIAKATGNCKTGMQSIRSQLDTWVKANC